MFSKDSFTQTEPRSKRHVGSCLRLYLLNRYLSPVGNGKTPIRRCRKRDHGPKASLTCSVTTSHDCLSHIW